MERDRLKGVKENGFKNNFNSHAHVERDNWGEFGVSNIDNFNSHAHVERDITHNNLCVIW